MAAGSPPNASVESVAAAALLDAQDLTLADLADRLAEYG
jgi:hypothetical protein